MSIFIAITIAFALHAGAEAQATTNEDSAAAALYRSPAEGGVRRWQATPDGELTLYDAPSEQATGIGILPDDRIFSNFGCAKLEDITWCEVRSFRGGVRGFVRSERLLPARGPDGIVPMGIDNGERRARKRDFDAKDTVPCAQEQGQKLGQCSAGAARGGGGDATVIVTFSNGFARRLFFVHGEFVSANSTMSGSGTDTDWRIDNGVHFIRVDDQRYEVPNALVFGD